MPLDFNSTKSFRDFVLSKTLQVPNGPQTFTANNYAVQNTNDFPNVDPGAVDTNRTNDLKLIQNTNTFKPLQYLIKDTIDTLPRRANLQLYYNGTPYFVSGNHNLVSIISNENYDNESELFKFAASYIRDKNQKGPVYSRIEQNLYKSTVGRVRLIDAINGNLSTAANIITGREPLVENNYAISVGKTVLGKGVDFLQTVAGVEFPWSEIPGDYLSNPSNPINVKPVPNSEFGKLLQDTTGALGSLLGIQRRPDVSRKPSDLFIEYMGSGQKQILYDQLSYSKYAPNYTTTARSQNTSKVFNFIDQFAQNIKNTLGVEAPSGVAYIGDDRGNDVKNAMNDFNDRPVRSNYYLSLLFDKTQTELFENKKNISEGGQASGKLTWLSINSKNVLGANNKNYSAQRSLFEESLSTAYQFRDDSLLGYTQDILDTMPTNGGERYSHIANVIDQTSRVFREGNVMISKGSAIRYVNKRNIETGVELCRTWTKDRPYLSYSDTMKKGNNIRKFDGSIISDPWNLNIAPMSNGKQDFDSTSNIAKGYRFGIGKDGKNFYAKKYMFSIENLAWKTSDKNGFTVLDLPICERGPNGGRVMWFPPYDLKVSENNSARWETNEFLGRPEPIYTYKNTERTGQISFKIVVDHPSVMNLLIRDVFQNMSDDEADNYINAFFAGCQEIDFYELIRRYATLDTDDVTNIMNYLNQNGSTTVITENKEKIESIPKESPEVVSPKAVTPTYTKVPINTITLHFDNNIPGTKNDIKTPTDYNNLYTTYIANKQTYINTLTSEVTQLNTKSLKDVNAKNDRIILIGSNITGSTIASEQATKISNFFDTLESSYQIFTDETAKLKDYLSKNRIKSILVKVDSSTSALDTVEYNKKLSLRRNYSVIKDFLKRISKDNNVLIPDNQFPWFTDDDVKNETNLIQNTFKISLLDIGYEIGGEIEIKVKSYGENWATVPKELSVNPQCSNNLFPTKNLNIYAPISFFCRRADISFEYELQEEPKKLENPEPNKVTNKETKSSLEPTVTQVNRQPTKPPIDVMKRIIMKTLSECFYFKKLEENSPLVFSSLREKLKYFHPAFHSTTPEGLNSRLTFLHQCIRPGDTIPVKGIEGAIKDTDARNTTFGPPPICILRIGDFYHSKVVIKDVNITYDDTTWDMNPEGIGYQPMIATVSLSVNFIGGQGLERPVELLQNALSSNFYANTEIYDERAISTNSFINGFNAEEYTKEFLEDLQNRDKKIVEPKYEDNNTSSVVENTFIGDIIETKIDYNNIIDKFYTATENYVSLYEKMYNIIIPKYGKKLSHTILSPTYRKINLFTVYKNSSTTEDINLFGLYPKSLDLQSFIFKLKQIMQQRIQSLNGYETNLCQIFGFDKVLTPQKISVCNMLLRTVVQNKVLEVLDGATTEKSISDFELVRDELVYYLDKLNFVTKYNVDFTIKEKKVYEVPISEFNSASFYNQYGSCVTYLSNCEAIFYSELDDSLEFPNLILSDTDFSYLLSILLYDYVNDIMEVFNKPILDFDEALKKNLRTTFENFVYREEPMVFNFGNPLVKTFNKETSTIEYEINGTEIESVNEELITDATNINTIPFIPTNNLNFYKLKLQ
jgi:hypothetical protein